MYTIVWQYKVHEGCETQFAEGYGPQGEWVRLFSKGDGFLGTELWRDHTKPHVFVTIDRWESPLHYNNFADGNAEEYQRIDAKYAPMCVREKRIGDYDSIVPA